MGVQIEAFGSWREFVSKGAPGAPYQSRRCFCGLNYVKPLKASK
jgi:hypothetical protein